MNEHIVVVGASHAGVAFVDALRSKGFSGEITMLDRLPGWPMERPPLSKSFLLGDGSNDEKHYLRKPEWFGENSIALRRGADVTAIDRTAKTVTLGDDSVINYDRLVLATGATPRMIVSAAELTNVHVVRDPNDATRVRAARGSAKNAIVIGGGYIGLETAASLRKSGLQVTVIEAANRLLARVASPNISQFFEELHRGENVDLHIGATIDEILSKDGAFSGVSLTGASGEQNVLMADMLIVGIGVVPQIGLAEMAGLECGNGILVAETMQTNDESIYAIGDNALCAATAPNVAGTAIRVESVHNAQDGASRAAAAIAGDEPPAWQSPWFWSEQFDARLQSAGIVPPAAPEIRHISRPGKREGGMSCWTFDGEILVAIEAVRDPASYMLGKKCLDSGKTPPRTQIGDPDFDIKAFLADQA